MPRKIKLEKRKKQIELEAKQSISSISNRNYKKYCVPLYMSLFVHMFVFLFLFLKFFFFAH